MSATFSDHTTSPAWSRAVATGTAVVTAVVIWALAVPIGGVSLRGPAGPGSTTTRPIGLASVLVMSLLAGLAGWGLLAVLERRTARARRIWTIIGATVLVVSLGGPLFGAGVSTSSRITLAALHLGVGGVLLALLPRTARR